MTLLKPVEFKVEADDPFKHDVLKRAGQAKMLTKIIGDLKVPFVLAIDSSFGTGKTTFIRMWREQLRMEDYKTVHFNAWENDFTENALVSLIGEFREAVQLSGGKESKVSAAALKVGAALAKSAIPIALKFATAGMIDSKELGEVISDATSKLAEERIKNYEEERGTIATFRNELEAFVKAKSPAKPLLFFVDELDRCRPLFAIEVLEHVKHLFSVPGIVFVLAVDKSQLGHSLRAVYGSGLDVDGYLARFLDLTYRLPQPEMRLFVASLIERFGSLNSLINQSGKNVDHAQIQGAFVIMNRLFPTALRIVEQMFTQFVVAWKLLRDAHVNPTLLITMIFIRRRIPERYNGFTTGEDMFEAEAKLLREWGKGSHLSDEDRFAANHLLALFRLFGLSNDASEKLKTQIRNQGNTPALAAQRSRRRYSVGLLWTLQYFGHPSARAV